MDLLLYLQKTETEKPKLQLDHTAGKNSRIHEGGHAEVGQHKEEDDAIV